MPAEKPGVPKKWSTIGTATW